MTSRVSNFLKITLSAAFLTACGCGEPAMPAIVPVQGVLLLDGQPLPKAEIRFQPTATGLPGDAGASAVTDDQGKFTMTTSGAPGAIAGEHIVTVNEGPPPEETRGDGQEAQMAATDYAKSLTNRPIPKIYTTAATSKCRVTVSADKREYEIKISR